MKSWYAISAKPHQEFLAESNLRNLGVETFLPLLREARVIRRKPQDVTVPLFPGYLFAKFDLERSYRGILYARGVRRIVSFGSAPAVVDEELIGGIKSHTVADGVARLGSAFSQGQLVRIHRGPLHGLEAVFEREMKGEQRAILLLRALSYQARVIVDLKDIVNL
jgi:transcriptional antiterminator RfaH